MVGGNKMGEYLSPGVYVEEVDMGPKPITGVSTSTVAFIGETNFVYKEGKETKDLTNKPQLISNWSQFTSKFGDFSNSAYLSQAVFGFFNNGGRRCYVNKVSPGSGTPEGEGGGGGRGRGASSSAKNSLAAAVQGEDNGPGARTGLQAFREFDDISILCAPGLVEKEVYEAVLSYCENQNLFAILDSPEELPTGGLSKLKDIRARDSKYGGYYFPWIQIVGGKYIPPSGHVAGIYARSDAERGVHKAPANEIVRGCVGLKYHVTKGEQDVLNPKGINCIRSFPGRGIRVWGARTLSSDPSWQYLNVRRLFIMIEESISRGTQWVVFEPNDRVLWNRISRDISAFLYTQWLSGALVGATPQEAFYVKCDEETNPEEIIQQGKVIIEIGIAPSRPAEFVIFRITQWSQGTSLAEA
jgi:phage tail sheath protein FI